MEESPKVVIKHQTQIRSYERTGCNIRDRDTELHLYFIACEKIYIAIPSLPYTMHLNYEHRFSFSLAQYSLNAYLKRDAGPVSFYFT